MFGTVAYLSRAALHKQHNIWKGHLPWVKPFYAVKCNNLTPLLTWMQRDFGPEIGFDCASQKEIEQVLHIGFENKPGIVFAQPCKSFEAMAYCEKHQIARTVVDCVEEVEKLRDANWSGEILIRLAVPDAGSKQPFSAKFGATLSETSDILRALKDASLRFSGFSFHVGSECMNPYQYYTALTMCSATDKIAKSFGYETRVIDIGGGFLPDESLFHHVGTAVQDGCRDFFSKRNDIEWIAEPGRFYAQPTVELLIPVIGAKKGRDIARVYTLDESIYGMFSCIPFDYQIPIFESVRPEQNSSCLPSRVFGRTCDSADILAKEVMLPPLGVGDLLRVKNMGAYTFVSSCEFNGFPKPKLEIVE